MKKGIYDFNDLFNSNDIINAFFNEFFVAGYHSNPRYSAYKIENGLGLEIPVPGAHKTDFDVNLNGDRLKIKYTLPEGESRDYINGCDRRQGEFELGFSFTKKVESIDAKYENGLLLVEIRFPAFKKDEYIEVK